MSSRRRNQSPCWERCQEGGVVGMWMDGWTDGMMMVMPGINKDITVAGGDRQINRAKHKNELVWTDMLEKRRKQSKNCTGVRLKIRAKKL